MYFIMISRPRVLVRDRFDADRVIMNPHYIIIESYLLLYVYQIILSSFYIIADITDRHYAARRISCCSALELFDIE